MSKNRELILGLVENAGKVIVGKEQAIKYLVATWLTEGHALLEDLPGTGKTVLAKTLSRLVNVPMGRVQFTPDLLPADITGSSIYDQQTHQFKFEKGPLFSTFFLADEINRATPRTQSALLEAMGERQVTSDRETHPLDKAFFVVATQNPIEHHGTFPLPEAQLDRFAIRLSLGHMKPQEEIKMLKDRLMDDPLDRVKPLMERSQFLEARQEVKKVQIHDSIYDYTVKIVELTRNSPDLEAGCSPRASLTLLKMAQALSFMNGEDFVRPKTIYELTPLVLGHRILLSQESRFSGITEDTFIKKLLSRISPPTSK